MSNIRKIFILAALIANLSFVNTFAAHADECSPKQLASLDMTNTAKSGITIPVTVNGQVLHMSINLANWHSFINAPAVARLNLNRVPSERRVEKIAPESAVIPSLQIGNSSTPSALLLISSNPDPATDGELALNVLMNFDVELDFQKNKLNLYSQQHCRSNAGDWISGAGVAAIPMDIQRTGDNEFVRFDLVLDDQIVRTAIALGKNESWMGLDTAERIFSIDEQSTRLVALGDQPANSAPRFHYPFGGLNLSGLAIEDPDIVLIKPDKPTPICDGKIHSGRICYGLAEMYLGDPILHQLRLYFAFGEKTLYAAAVR